MARCSACGELTDSAAARCPKCGSARETAAPRSTLTAGPYAPTDAPPPTDHDALKLAPIDGARVPARTTFCLALPDRQPPRTRRDGRGLPRRRSQAGIDGCAQAVVRLVATERGSAGALRARGATGSRYRALRRIESLVDEAPDSPVLSLGSVGIELKLADMSDVAASPVMAIHLALEKSGCAGCED
jgi:hypothetical protein